MHYERLNPVRQQRYETRIDFGEFILTPSAVRCQRDVGCLVTKFLLIYCRQISVEESNNDVSERRVGGRVLLKCENRHRRGHFYGNDGPAKP